MGKRISDSLRSEVTQRWIKYESRNKIAAICGISQGAVSDIIDEWKRSVVVSLLVSGHSEDDLELVLNAISLVKENGCDLLEIAAQFSENEQLKSSE